MSYHVEAPRFGFKELPDRILVREDGAYGASNEHGEPIIDHWYVPEQNASQAALERRIDELCAEVERLHADQAHWELGNCPSCPNIADLQEALEQNAKLREFASEAFSMSFNFYHGAGTAEDLRELTVEYRELGIEANE